MACSSIGKGARNRAAGSLCSAPLPPVQVPLPAYLCACTVQLMGRCTLPGVQQDTRGRALQMHRREATRGARASAQSAQLYLCGIGARSALARACSLCYETNPRSAAVAPSPAKVVPPKTANGNARNFFTLQIPKILVTGKLFCPCAVLTVSAHILPPCAVLTVSAHILERRNKQLG